MVEILEHGGGPCMKRATPPVQSMILRGCAALAIAWITLAFGACSTGSARTWNEPRASVQSRPFRVWTLERRDAPRLLIIGSIHGDEACAIPSLPSLNAAIAAHLSKVSVRIIEDANPDGTALRTRWNSRGVDLNRNWPTKDFHASRRNGPLPLSEPETQRTLKHIIEFAPSVILVCHAARNGPYVNFDGPAIEYATAFAQSAAVGDPRWETRASMGYPTPGSLGTYAGDERAIPILTIEFHRAHDPAAVGEALISGTLAVIDAMDRKAQVAPLP